MNKEQILSVTNSLNNIVESCNDLSVSAANLHNTMSKLIENPSLGISFLELISQFLSLEMKLKITNLEFEKLKVSNDYKELDQQVQLIVKNTYAHLIEDLDPKSKLDVK